MTRLKLGRLIEAAIYASDLGAAERFYRDALGLEVVSSFEGRVWPFSAVRRSCSFSIRNGLEFPTLAFLPTVRSGRATSLS